SPGLHAQDTYAYSGEKQQKTNRQNVDTNKKPDDTKQTLFTVLKDLNKTRGIFFLFSDQSFGDRLVSPVKNENAELEKILKQILENTGLKYKKVNEKTFVILSARETAASANEIAPVTFSETQGGGNEKAVADIVAGKVTDSTGSPLAGV